MSNIRVLVVDDHAILRDGIRSLLERQDGISVVGEAANGREALEQVSAKQPDLVLMDVAMPEMNGLEATRMIKELYPQVRVLILTQHDSREYVAPLLQAGASGYVLKRSGGREVVSAIRDVFERGAFLEPAVARQVLDDYTRSGPAVSDGSPLTERERQVLQLLIAGNSNKQIASVLGISPKTVSVHRSNIMTKLDVSNTVELIRYVTEHNFLDDSNDLKL